MSCSVKVPADVGVHSMHKGLCIRELCAGDGESKRMIWKLREGCSNCANKSKGIGS